MCEEKGMDMLTTAVVMSAGREQTGILPVSSDRAQDKGQSFAKSFDEEVALAVDADTKTSSDEGVAEVQHLTTRTPLQVSGEPVATAVAIKTGTGSDRAGAESEGNKSVAVTMSVNGPLVPIVSDAETNTNTSRGVVTASDDAIPVLGCSLVQTPEEDVGAVQESAAGTIDEAAGAHPAVQQDTAVAAADVVSTKVVRGKGQERSVVPRVVEEPSGNEKTGATESAVPVASAKKTSKGEEQKATSAARNATTAVANATLDSGALGGASVPVAVVVPVPAQSNGAAKASKANSSDKETGKTISKAIVMISPERGAAAIVVGGAVPGEGKTGPGTAPVASPADEASSAKGGSESAKSVALALAVGDGDAGKTQKADAAAGPSHNAATGLSLAGLISGVVPLHGVGGAVSTNVRAQDGSAQTATGLHAGHGELDGGGGVTPPAMDGAHRTLAATPTALEVGVTNGTHGWLKIRAELATGGGVNASLSAASSGGQEMLHRELPSLAAYLQQAQVAVNSVVVHPAMAGNDSHGLAGGMGGDVSGQTQQRNDQGGETRHGLNDPVPSHVETGAYEVVNGVGAGGLLSPVTYAGGGSWLNVRA
jgi:hypothetical protein